MSDSKELAIQAMFSAENFREMGHALIDLLADHLKLNLSGTGKVIHWHDPNIEDSMWQAPLPMQPTINHEQLLAKLNHEILPQSLAIHHPHNLGHQVATPLPIAALCDLVASLTNQAMAVYETGPSATMLERQVIRWLTDLIGWQTVQNSHTHGILTSGGAQANLTALLAARQYAATWDVWQCGTHAPEMPKLKILASEHTHYSIARAAGIMGLGTEAVIKIATDHNGSMDLSELKKAHQQCIARDEIIVAVVATAGCTPTGSIDPLLAIGGYCNAQKVWLHVDGAHGASALLSNQYRANLSGIDLADSVVWDGHKLLYMPAPVSAVLFKNPLNSYQAFAQDASYLFQGNSIDDESYNISYRTLECTKRMMALKLWTAFSLYGVEGMGSLVDIAFEKAQLFADLISTNSTFELLMRPQTNIVCFKHKGKNWETSSIQQKNQHQINLRQKAIQSGEFHLTQVMIDGECWLRTTLMNPMTTKEDLSCLLNFLSEAER